MFFSRRAAGLAALVMLAVGLAACGDSEPDQRKAFIEFLQTRIVDKSGVHIPQLTDEQKKSFGPYADQYAIIPAFANNPELLAVAKKMQAATQTISLTSVQALIDHRAELKSVSEDLGTARAAMNSLFATTNAARAALKQPDDLKAVFDKAYEKDVGAPVRGFNETIPIVMDIAAAALKLADYVDSHRSAVTVSARSVGSKDPQTAKDLDALVKDLTRYDPIFRDAQRRLSIVLQGS